MEEEPNYFMIPPNQIANQKRFRMYRDLQADDPGHTAAETRRGWWGQPRVYGNQPRMTDDFVEGDPVEAVTGTLMQCNPTRGPMTWPDTAIDGRDGYTDLSNFYQLTQKGQRMGKWKEAVRFHSNVSTAGVLNSVVTQMNDIPLGQDEGQRDGRVVTIEGVTIQMQLRYLRLQTAPSLQGCFFAVVWDNAPNQTGNPAFIDVFNDPAAQFNWADYRPSSTYRERFNILKVGVFHPMVTGHQNTPPDDLWQGHMSMYSWGMNIECSTIFGANTGAATDISSGALMIMSQLPSSDNNGDVIFTAGTHVFFTDQ